MCGIFACFKNNSFPYSFDNFKKDNLLLKNRGPDANNCINFQNSDNSIYLGHNRLSIQDISINGSQPMYSYSGRYCIIYNGEIYNHKELRKLIQNKINISWKSNSDTETLINLFELFNYDIKKFLNLLEGQFAFAIYDIKLNELLFARDKVGEKPLYFSTNSNFFAIASDLKPLSKIPEFKKNISQIALKKYLKYNYIPSPFSIFEGTFKLPSASYIKINFNNFQNILRKNFNEFICNKNITFEKWWSLNNLRNEKIVNNKNPKTYKETKKIIESDLINSVKNQQISDVPLGAFLSGGIDSSLIVSLMKKLNFDTKTFSIGFNFSEYDESKHSNKIAKYLQTNHHEYIFTHTDAQKIIPQLTNSFSEPFADSSQIPTMLLSSFASDHVTVALSGDGGDELFGGYNRYLLGIKYLKYEKKIPRVLKQILIKSFNYIPENILGIFFNILMNNNILEKIDKIKVKKIKDKINFIDNKYDFYKSMISEFNDSKILNFKIDDDVEINKDLFKSDSHLTFLEAMMHNDFENYLSDDILCKVDRSSMHSSLETRCPFLNTNLITNSYLMPPKFKINNNNTKYILKDILENYLPKQLINNKKQGFAVPISIWMRTDLKEWTNDLLSESILKKHNFFNIDFVKKLQNQHYLGETNNENKLWSILQFNQWYNNFF